MKLNILSVLLLFPVLSFGQVIVNPLINLSEGHTIREDTYSGMEIKGLEYNPSALFTSRDSAYSFRIYPRGNYLTAFFKIKAKENDLTILFHNSYLFTKQDSVTIHSIYPGYQHYGVNSSHLYRIEEDMQASLLKGIGEVRTLLESHSYYYPHEYAVNTFNADTVISYDVNFHDRYSKKINLGYKKCKALLIQKNDRGYFVLYCCYDEDKYFDQYFGEIEKMFKYE